jgi:nucleoside diphosphate kinase
MKKILALLLVLSSFTAFTQDVGLPPRAYTKAELDRWSQVCGWLSKAMPHSFKTYTTKETNCGAFEWAERDKQRRPLTVINKKNEPIGNNPNLQLWFTKSEDSTEAEYNRLLLKIKDAQKPDGTFDQKKYSIISAEMEKHNQCLTVAINVMVNVKVELAKQYYVATKPIKLELGVPAFGYLYTFPGDKLILDENGDGMGGTDANAFYQDKVLVIISNKAPKVVAPPAEGKTTWREDKIFPQDNCTDVSTAPVKNIVIEINGAEADVRAIVKQVDWKALQLLLDK